MEQSLKIHRIKRNVIFWGKNAEIMMATMLLLVLVYGFVYSISIPGQFDVDKIVSYTVMCTIIFSLVTPMSFGNTYIPLTISFGAGRKETVCGMQITGFLMLLQCEILAAINISMSEFLKDYLGYALVALLAAALSGWAIGQIGVAFSLKYGMKGNLILIPLIILVFGAYVAMAVFGVAPSVSDRLGLGTEQLMAIIIAVAVAVSVILYLVGLTILFRIVKKIEVRR